MLNIIPHFIYKNYIDNIYKGTFSGFSLFLDISGFTSMTEELMKRGKEGAEILSNIINQVFKPIIDVVYSKNGYISGFAGDAFTAIFPENSLRNLLVCANDIQKIFEKEGTQYTRFGSFNIYAKIGLSYGDIEWGIVGKKGNFRYFYRGEAIDSCALAEHFAEKGDIILTEKLYKMFEEKDLEVKFIKKGFYKLLNYNFQEEISNKKDLNLEEMNKDVILDFFPKEVANYSQIGEFREVFISFISFKEEIEENFDEFINKIIEKVELYGGFLNKLDFGDKGGTILVFFGAPIYYEGLLKRCLKFSLDVKKEFGSKIRSGITYGTVYVGYVGSPKRCEYTGLGNTINLAARFMQNAEWGDCWVSDEIYHKADNYYEFNYLGEKNFKGRSDKIKVYNLLEEKSNEIIFYTTKMFGREYELQQLNQFSKAIFKKKFAGVTYIYGDAGIGKSRLIYEFESNLKNKVNTCNLQIDEIVKKSMNPFIYFFNNYFKQTDILDEKEKKDTFNNILNKYINNLKKINDSRKDEIIDEILKKKAFIGKLIGIDIEDDLYESLNSEQRFQNTIYAIKDFFKGLSLIKPLIIVLEDLHFVDEDSKKVFQILTRNIENYPLMILIGSRFRDDGTKPVLLLDEEIICNEIILKPLENNYSFDLIKFILSEKVDENLLQFILDKTEGNPFFIEQFCMYLKENNIIEEINGKINLKKEKIETIPLGINSILLSRIDRLSQELKEIMQMASILGKEFDVIILKKMLELLEKFFDKNKDDFQEEISIVKNSEKEIYDLLEKGKLELLWINYSEIKYIFRHAILRDEIYEMQLKDRLRRLHKIAAEAIESQYQNNENYYSEIAYHYHRAECFSKAKEYLFKEAFFEEKKYQNEKALTTYELLTNYIENKNDEMLINYKKAILLNIIGKNDEAITCLKKAIDLSIELGDIDNEIRYKSYLAKLINMFGDYLEAFQLLENISDKVLHYGSTEVHAYYDYIYGNIYKGEDQTNVKMKYFNDSYRYYKNLENELEALNVLLDISLVYYRNGDYDKAMEYAQNVLNEAEKKDAKNIIGKAYNRIGNIFFKKYEIEKALDYYTKELEINKELGDKKLIARTNNNLGVIYVQLDNYEKANEYFSQASSVLEELNDKIGLSDIYNNLGVIALYSKNYEAALEYFNKVLKISEKLLDKEMMGTAFMNIGVVYQHIKEFKKSIIYLKKSIKIREILSDQSGLASSYENCALTYLKQKKYNFSAKFYLAALNIRKEIHLSKKVSENYYNLINCCIKNKNYKKALNYLLEYFEYSKNNSCDLFTEIYLLTAICLAQINLNFKNKKINKLNIIKEMTSFSLNPEEYFNYCVEHFKDNNEALASTFFEYGKYLIKNNNLQDGIKKIKNSYAIAIKENLTDEIDEINNFCKNNKINIE